MVLGQVTLVEKFRNIFKTEAERVYRYECLEIVLTQQQTHVTFIDRNTHSEIQL